MGRIGEEEECSGYKCYVEYVVAGAAENLFYEYHGECRGYGEHPYRSLNGAYHGDEDAGDEEPLLNLLATPLGYDEFNAETYGIGHYDSR